MLQVGREPVVITAASVRCAAGDQLALPQKCLGAAEPWAAALGVPMVAQVPDLVEDPEFPDDRKGSLAAATLARLPRLSGARYGLFLGTGLSSLTPAELEQDLYPHLAADGSRFDRAQMARDLSGRAQVVRHLPEHVTHLLAGRIAQTNQVITAETSFSACAAAAQAIAEAARAVASGRVDVAIAGGHDSMLHPIGMLSFVVLGALSTTVSRPFDRHRDGFLIGEGAALLQLERERDARARGAKILGYILGAGSSVDAWNVTAPHPEGRGAELAMRRALVSAGLGPGDIDYVNAHGTGTPVGDKAEALAIVRVLGEVPVSSFKGAVGHTIAAAGAVEAALCLACFTENQLPASVGLEELDPALPANVLKEPVFARPRAILSNSFGFGGQNCALILGAPA